ncbi:HalOD1 output domain-containing protein [Natronolimnohabitans sp. A-GB9]|uniref:HalOD1 output domain-containing protein n=1 Tax=Natronolimnohabitans sp. A-GB9 TaxID=3069757 RepID=UPI0027B58A66|nr:HalOD1 output domain-containing protein [Natronolimnohabitans sp. A-GB9]MDQ2051469.1 HalOD1 output domain-containing protein [Natronolimnohabitans sp. A-GB9]
MTEGGGDSVDTSYRTAPSRTVIEAVAEAEGIPPEELRPPTYEALHDIVDPEALDSLFASRSNGTPRSAGDVTFPFCGYEVTVRADDTVTVEDTSE